MKVQIVSQFGNMTFEMSQEKAMQIITQAMQLTNAREQENASDLDIRNETPVETAPLSRVERMFGKKETWSVPKGEPARPFVRSETGKEGVGAATTQRRTPEMISKLANYEDLEEQGRMFVSPFPLGTAIYDRCGKRFIIHEIRFLQYGTFVTASGDDSRFYTFRIDGPHLDTTVFTSPPNQGSEVTNEDP